MFLFSFLGSHHSFGDTVPRLTLSFKLPQSSDAALTLPFATPTGYGLGKSGWVTATFTPADQVPTDLLLSWLDESYHAIAPKRRRAAS